MIVQGAGAGAEITAHGVLADTIKIAEKLPIDLDYIYIAIVFVNTVVYFVFCSVVFSFFLHAGYIICEK